MTPKEFARLQFIANWAMTRNYLQSIEDHCRETGINPWTFDGEPPEPKSFTFTPEELDAILTVAAGRPKGRPPKLSHIGFARLAREEYEGRLIAKQQAARLPNDDPKGAVLKEMGDEAKVSPDTISAWIWPRSKGNK